MKELYPVAKHIVSTTVHSSDNFQDAHVKSVKLKHTGFVRNIFWIDLFVSGET